MPRLDWAQLVVGGAYARRHAGDDTLELIVELERENAWLRDNLNAKRAAGIARAGRYVFGRLVAGGVLVIGAALVLSWFYFTSAGAW